MRTYSGREVDVFNMKEDDFSIEDIAHSLSHICRFTGHTREHYSVAQHCVHVSLMAPLEIALEALMHEREEPYTNDLHTDLKHSHWMRGYRAIGDEIAEVCARKFGLIYNDDINAQIKYFDNKMCEWEKQCLFKDSTCHQIEPWPADYAEERFLERFITLNARRFNLDS